MIEVIDEWRPAIGSNSAANIFEGNIGTVLFRDARYRWRAPDFTRVCIYDLPPISDLRQGNERDNRGNGQRRAGGRDFAGSLRFNA